MKLNKKTLIRWKVYFDRARMYIGYINFFMMVIIFINSIKDNKFGHYLVEYYAISIPILMVLFIGASFVLGYFDSKLGIRSEEMRNVSISNPILMEILNLLKKLNIKEKENGWR